MHCRILILHKSCKVLGCPKKEREREREKENILSKYHYEDFLHNDSRDHTSLNYILGYINNLGLLSEACSWIDFSTKLPVNIMVS